MRRTIPLIVITTLIMIVVWWSYSKPEVILLSKDGYLKHIEALVHSDEDISNLLPSKKPEGPIKSEDNSNFPTKKQKVTVQDTSNGCSINPLSKVSQPSSSSCQLHETNITIYMDSFKWVVNNWMGNLYYEFMSNSKKCPPLPGGGVCTYETNDKCADGIFFFCAHSDLKFTKQHPDQIIITFTREAENGPYVHFPPNFHHDVKVSYTRTSNVPVPFICKGEKALQLYNTGQPEIRKGKSGIVGMISNCDSKYRNEYITELMKHTAIDQLGNCYTTKTLKVSTPRPPNWEHKKLDFLRKSHYRYLLAFENSVASDYVTEKAIHGLLSGLIPIYYGDRSVFDFIPGNHTIIFAPDYTPKQLADYINQIDNDEELSSSFFKDWDLKKMLTIHEQYCADDFMCRVCRKALEVRYHQKGCTNMKLMEKGDH